MCSLHASIVQLVKMSMYYFGNQIKAILLKANIVTVTEHWQPGSSPLRYSHSEPLGSLLFIINGKQETKPRARLTTPALEQVLHYLILEPNNFQSVLACSPTGKKQVKHGLLLWNGNPITRESFLIDPLVVNNNSRKLYWFLSIRIIE